MPEPLAGTAVVVMGVSGSGKTALAMRLAQRLGAPFGEADDLHAPEAKALMAAGTPLTDADRHPWLLRMRGRRGHFMPAALLDAQIATLEPLGPDEEGVVLANDGTLDQLTTRGLTALRALLAAGPATGR